MVRSRRNRDKLASMETAICKWCGRSFKPRHAINRHCSRACGQRTRYKENRAMVGCASCGKSLERRLSNATKFTRHYCSWACKNAHQEIRYSGNGNPHFKGLGWKVCIGCGSRFYDTHNSRRFCGVDCSQRIGSSENLRNARRGADTERRCRKLLESQGYTVVRSAASKSPWDLIAVGSNDIRLVQCKLQSKERSVRPIVAALTAISLPKTSLVRQELWVWVQRRGWRVQVI